MLGEALALSSALLFGLSTVLIKTVVPRVDSITVTAVRLITGAVFAVLVSILTSLFTAFVIVRLWHDPDEFGENND